MLELSVVRVYPSMIIRIDKYENGSISKGPKVKSKQRL